MGKVELKGRIRSGLGSRSFRSRFTSCALAVRFLFTCCALLTQYWCGGRGKESLQYIGQDRPAASKLMRTGRRASERCDGGRRG